MLFRSQVLEIVPGDRITVTYADPSVINPERQKLEAFLDATFFNARMELFTQESMVDLMSGGKQSLYLPSEYFVAGSRMAVLVEDSDEDRDATSNSVPVKVRTVDGRELAITAKELGAHNGAFFGTFETMVDAADRPGAIKVNPGEDLSVQYRDEENTDVRIPWNRTADSRYGPQERLPTEFRLFTYRSMPFDTNTLQLSKATAAPAKGNVESIPASHVLTCVRPSLSAAQALRLCSSDCSSFSTGDSGEQNGKREQDEQERRVAGDRPERDDQGDERLHEVRHPHHATARVAVADHAGRQAEHDVREDG